LTTAQAARVVAGAGCPSRGAWSRRGRSSRTVDLLGAAGRHHRAPPLHAPAAWRAVGATAGRAVDHPLTPGPLGVVVRRLDPRDADARPQGRRTGAPFPARPRRRRAHARRAPLPVLPRDATPRRHRRREAGPGPRPRAHAVPPREPGLGGLPSPRADRAAPDAPRRDSAAVISPAARAPRAPAGALAAVAEDHRPGGTAPPPLGDRGPPRGGARDDGHPPRPGGPAPRRVPPRPPGGRVVVGRGGRTHVLPECRDRGHPRRGARPLPPGAPAPGERPAPPVVSPRTERPLAEPVGPGPDAEDGPRPGAARPGGHSRRPGRPGRGAAAGALPAIEPVVSDRGRQRRHRGAWAPEWFALIAVAVVTPPAATWGPAGDDLPEWLGWDHGPGARTVTGWPTPCPPRGGSRGTSLDREGSGRR
jgi:hypothetical protein